jgi:UDP-N-acetylmuramyl pentapeptide phosphotransferase/UDP-N-acetylglucosamine-1-phosphate transferase
VKGAARQRRDTMTDELWSIGISAICAASLMPLVMGAFSCGSDKVSENPQNIHDRPTSRLGGVVVFTAYVAAVVVALELERVPLRSVLPLLIAVLPILLIGLWEDIFHRARPRHRLFALFVSAVLASAFAQGVIPRLDLSYIDRWLEYLPFVLPLTWFMVAGACNSVNIIDGAHGLAGGTSLLMFAGIAIMSANVGDVLVFVQAAGMVGAIAGFLIWNYPGGKVFLGDFGAYFIGFMYAQLSIQLIARNSSISAWFVIALAAYPIIETLYSIYRRRIILRRAPMQPDALHLHSLIYRRLAVGAKHSAPNGFMRHANARVAPRMWLHGALCCAAALLISNNTPALIGFTLFYGLHYVTCYQAATFRLSVAEMQRGAQFVRRGEEARARGSAGFIGNEPTL